MVLSLAFIILTFAHFFSLQKSNSYDVYEATLMKAVLLLKNNLGHLIFGTEAWKKLASKWNIPVSAPSDALSKHYGGK